MEKFILCLEKELKAQLKEEAQAKHMSLAAYIRSILYLRGK